MSNEAEFAVGSIVSVRANPDIRGAVTQVIPGEHEARYVLFLDGSTSVFYASQLQLVEQASERPQVLSPEVFKGRLTALQLKEPSLSALYSLHAARVNFVPYQFRPVIKFIRSDRPRLLIADEVGVGKTIEAGLILRELQSRRELNNVLIVCPKPLVTERKWQLEMMRFDEQFVHLDGAALRNCIRETDLNGVWPENQSKAIVPFSLFDERLLCGSDGGRRNLGLLGLDPPPRFDMVIVDEAHHLRNTNTYVHQGVRFLCEHAEAVVFLTATPIQLRSDDLYVLLNRLRPDIILDRNSFEYMSAPNPMINEAISRARSARDDWAGEALSCLEESARTDWGRAMLQTSPDYVRLCQTLKRRDLSATDRLAFIRDAEALHTFAGLINRTRRRDIGSYFTIRKAEAVEVEFTESQQRLHDDLLATQARILNRIHGDKGVGFMMTTLRRQAASCLYGLAPLIREILSRHLDEAEFEEADESYEGNGADLAAGVESDIRAVLAFSESLTDEDPKLDALLRIVSDKQAMPNNKILLFSSFRHTLRYLLSHLQRGGIRVGLIHGGIPDDERRDLRDRFSLPKEDGTAIDLLLSSEVGCEGLDYQFCDCLVNYDLPWNPMRIEQRIGRIDRYGQESETVAIYNLITPGTVDYDIYQRCHLRIGVFRAALGGSEEILGRITSEIRAIAESLELTAEERRSRLQQLADNEIRVIQEQAELEDRQSELFGIVLPPRDLEQEVEDASNVWLTPDSIRNLVELYLADSCGGEGHVYGESDLKSLRLNQDSRERLLLHFREMPRVSSPLYREWEKWLKGVEPRLDITFDAACAAAHRKVVFITPIHPLAQQAAMWASGQEPFFTACRVKAAAVAPGEYPFAVYQWRKYGVREDCVLQPVSMEADVQANLLKLLESSTQLNGQQGFEPDPQVIAELEKRHYREWASAREEHQSFTLRLAQYRRESLSASHRARLSLLKEQLTQADNPNIRRMRQSQIASADADYERRVQEITEAERRVDIVSRPVAYGVLMVEG